MSRAFFQVMKLRDLKPHENTDENKVNYVINQIQASQKWISPVIIDRETKIIMDGHHRVRAAKQIGLELIPCYIAEYSDKNVNVSYWRTGKTLDISIIYKAVEKGILLPKKTTKHILEYDLQETAINIKELLQS